MATREEEMAKLRERYARLQKGEKEPVEQTKREEPIVIKTKIKKPRINLKPYFLAKSRTNSKSSAESVRIPWSK